MRYTTYMDPQSAQQQDQPEQKQELLVAWNSPSRLFKRRTKEFFVNVGVIVFLLLIILVFAKEFVLVLAVVSIVFLIYVLSTVPPEDVTHRITNLGIESAGHYYRWEQLAEFWFEQKWGQKLLMIRPLFGSLIIILLGQKTEDEIRQVLASRIVFREHPQKSWVDNASSWLSEKIPLEKP